MPSTRFLYLFLLVNVHFTWAQGIKGILTNSAGEPLPYVTIYCIDTKTGTNSNVNGSFQLKLAKGTHQISFQSIDYKTLSKTIQIENDWQELNLEMEKQTYELKEVTVNSGKDNPANYIMRKAIAAAPYYKRQVLNYQANVYVKGTGRIDQCPRIFRGLLKEQHVEVGKTYVTESINQLNFSQPNTYREKVISVKSSMPFEGAPEPMRMARGSWYDASNENEVSPLSAQAFNAYTFKLEGSFYENGREINKIKVEPKRKGNEFYSGTIYIIEKLWCLHSCVLTREESGTTVTVKTSFKPISEYPFVYMPVTYDIQFKGNYLGVEGSFRYLASISDYRLKLNPNVSHTWVQQITSPPKIAEEANKPSKPIEAKKSKNQQQIDALLAKEKLTKGEMLKLASKMKKEAENNTQTLMMENDSSELIIDSLAFTRDSNFWANNRPVPLLKDEQQSFKVKDTSQLFGSDSTHKKKNYHLSLGSILLLGDSLTKKDHKNYFSYKGLFGRPSLNTVEGFALQTELSFGNKGFKQWRYTQKIKVPLERPLLETSGELSFRFNPKHLAYVQFKGGSFITDYNPKGITPFTDAFQLLLLKTNYSKFYQQDFLNANFQYEVLNGLLVNASILATNRYSIENIDRYQNKEGKDHIRANVPDKILISEPRHQSYQYQLGLVYKPFQLYKMRQNKKFYLKNTWPSLSVNYKEGYDAQGLQFGKLDFGLDQTVKPWHWVNLMYQARAGFFTKTPNLYFADWQHFAGNQSSIFDGNYFGHFMQLPYYSYSTNRSYQSLFLQAEFKHLLLRKLPYLNLMDFKEVVYFNYLNSQGNAMYYETGYRIEPLLNRIAIGVNFHFISNTYQGAAFRMSIRL